MHPNVRHLIELQGVDLRLAELRGRLDGFPKRLSEVGARVEAARKQLALAKEALTASLKERKKYDLDVEQWKQKVAKYKDQLYEVKTNEAYKALQHEIQMMESEIAKAEDQLLEQMVAGEEYERRVKAAERALAEVEAVAQAERQKLQAEQAVAQKEFEALTAEHEQVVVAIPEDLLDLYQRIARKHGGAALAEVRDETCTMCRVRVRPQVYQLLRDDSCQEIFHCESCTRILYHLEQPVAQASEQ